MSKSITRPLFCDPKILSSFGHDVSRLLNYLHIEALTCKAGSTKNQRKVNLNHVLSKTLADSAIVHVFSIKPIAVAVAQSLFLMSFVSVSFASGGYNLDLDLPSTTSRGAVIFKNFNDTVDGTQGQTLYYSSGSNDNSLIVTFDQAYPIFQAWNAPYDNQFYIAGGIRTLPGGAGKTAAEKLNYYNALGGTVVTKDGLQYVSYGGDDYYLTTNGKSDGSPLSDSASGYNLTVNIQPGSTGTLKIYGGRNDLFTLQPGLENKGTSAQKVGDML